MQSRNFSGYAGLHLAPQLLHDLHWCLPSASIPGQHYGYVRILTDVHCHACTTQPHVLSCVMVGAELHAGGATPARLLQQGCTSLIQSFAQLAGCHWRCGI